MVSQRGGRGFPGRELLGSGLAPLALGMIGSFLFVYVAGGIALGWLPAFLAARGYVLSQTSLAMSAWSAAGIAGSLAIGWLTLHVSTWGAARMTALAGIGISAVLAITLGLMVQPPVWIVFALLVVCGALLSAMIVVLYACAAQCFPSHLRASGIGFCATAGKIGGFVGSFGGASLIERAGGLFYFPAFALALVAMLLSLMIATPAEMRRA